MLNRVYQGFSRVWLKITDRFGSGRIGSADPTRPAILFRCVHLTRPDPTREILKASCMTQPDQTLSTRSKNCRPNPTRPDPTLPGPTRPDPT